jgi:hypothetical protein
MPILNTRQTYWKSLVNSITPFALQYCLASVVGVEMEQKDSLHSAVEPQLLLHQATASLAAEEEASQESALQMDQVHQTLPLLLVELRLVMRYRDIPPNVREANGFGSCCTS